MTDFFRNTNLLQAPTTDNNNNNAPRASDTNQLASKDLQALIAQRKYEQAFATVSTNIIMLNSVGLECPKHRHSDLVDITTKSTRNLFPNSFASQSIRIIISDSTIGI